MKNQGTYRGGVEFLRLIFMTVDPAAVLCTSGSPDLDFTAADKSPSRAGLGLTYYIRSIGWDVALGRLRSVFTSKNVSNASEDGHVGLTPSLESLKLHQEMNGAFRRRSGLQFLARTIENRGESSPPSKNGSQNYPRPFEKAAFLGFPSSPPPASMPLIIDILQS
ncbi:hypothetical protein D9757_013102 [Collybiopsis confluens]|uniref:Uncharacterized protein n=1 Tax=Collybiopsis confluens TaxID=2823264 RepID=A0A8H5FUE9_9AGAR|nr:hypothetical protein D9757_013102 [Collybiopsis confluens]